MRYIWTLLFGVIAGAIAGAAALAFYFLTSKTGLEFVKEWSYKKTKEIIFESSPSDFLIGQLSTHQQTLDLYRFLSGLIEQFGVYTVEDVKIALDMTLGLEDRARGWTELDGVLQFTKNYTTGGWNVRLMKAPQVLV